MHLRLLDQITISSVRPEMLIPREVIEVTDEQGAELLQKHPRTFRAVNEAGEPLARTAATGRKKIAAHKPEGTQK